MKLDVPSNYVAIGRMLPQVEVHRRVKPTADGTLPVMLYGGSLLRRELFFDRDGELQDQLPVHVFGDGFSRAEYLSPSHPPIPQGLYRRETKKL